MSVDERPFVVTVRIDAAAQERLDRERAALFPPGRTAVGAHLTLFHAVPATRAGDVLADLADVATREPFAMLVPGLVPLGRGVAYRVESPELDAIHRELQGRWHDDLTAQDRQRRRPHVTVQNKVAPETARATLQRLQDGFAPFGVDALGLLLWRYDGGPWEAAAELPFRPDGVPDRSGVSGSPGAG